MSGAGQSWFAGFVGTLETEAKNFASAAVENVENFVTQDVEPVAEAFFPALAQIALGAVLQQAPLILSGAEKFGAATVSVIQQVEAQGQTLATNDAHAVVQAAFDKLKQLSTGTEAKQGS